MKILKFLLMIIDRLIIIECVIRELCLKADESFTHCTRKFLSASKWMNRLSNLEAGFIDRFENADAHRRSATEQPLLAISLLNIVEN